MFRRRKWRFQFSLAALLGVVTVVALLLGLGPPVRTYLAVRALANKDVHVDGTTLGLMVRIDSTAATQLKSLGHRANSALQRALDDPEKFAAAHVLLTEINEGQEFDGSASHWNEMKITLYADGRVDFHPEQIPQLQEYWKLKLARGAGDRDPTPERWATTPRHG